MPPRRTQHRLTKLAGSLALAPCLLAAIPAGPRDPALAGEVIVRSRSQSIVRALEAALMISEQEGGTIRLAGWRGVLRTAAEQQSVLLIVEADGKALLQKVEGDKLALDVYLYALREDKTVQAAVSRHLQIDLAAHRALLLRGGLKLPMTLELPPGSYALRVLVRTASQVFGVRTISAKVSKVSPEHPSLLPLMVPETVGSWLIALGPSEGEGLDRNAWPLAVGGRSLLPAALPVIGENQTLSGYLFWPRQVEASSQVVALLRSNQDQQIRRLRVALRQSFASPFPEYRAVAVEIDLAGLRPAVYSLELVLDDPGSSSELTLPSLLIVSGAAEPSLWPGLELDLAPGRQKREIAASRMEEAQEPGRARTPQPEAAISERYRDALGRLATGDWSAARRQVRDLETEALGASAANGRDRLRASLEQVIQELAELGWGSLQPVLRLHAELASEYRGRRLTSLAKHAIDLSCRLADGLVAAQADPRVSRFAAIVLANLAIGEQSAGNLERAATLFLKALQYDDRLTLAHLGLAVIRERQGHYRKACEALERLLTLQPHHPEARLRLAVCKYRTGKTRAARALFEELILAPVPPWIGLLAHQELARLALDGRRPQEARDILQAGLQRWPGSFTLRIQLAFVLDHLGRARAAQELLAVAEQSLEAEVSSERWLYNRWPVESLAETHSWLEQESSARLPELREALVTPYPAGILQ